MRPEAIAYQESTYCSRLFYKVVKPTPHRRSVALPLRRCDAWCCRRRRCRVASRCFVVVSGMSWRVALLRCCVAASRLVCNECYVCCCRDPAVLRCAPICGPSEACLLMCRVLMAVTVVEAWHGGFALLTEACCLVLPRGLPTLRSQTNQRGQNDGRGQG